MPTIENKFVYFKSERITTALRHVLVAENTRKLLWSRIKSPRIHLSVGLNAPVRNFLSSKSIPFFLFNNGYQPWPISHWFILCLHPIPTKKRCCRVQMFNNCKVHTFLISQICWLYNWWIITHLPLPALFHLLKAFSAHYFHLPFGLYKDRNILISDPTLAPKPMESQLCGIVIQSCRVSGSTIVS